MDAPGFLKQKVDLFKDFSTERIKELVNGSVVRSFEANEAIAHQGAEATHFGVVLSGDLFGRHLSFGITSLPPRKMSRIIRSCGTDKISKP